MKKLIYSIIVLFYLCPSLKAQKNTFTATAFTGYSYYDDFYVFEDAKSNFNYPAYGHNQVSKSIPFGFRLEYQLTDYLGMAFEAQFSNIEISQKPSETETTTWKFSHKRSTVTPILMYHPFPKALNDKKLDIFLMGGLGLRISKISTTTRDPWTGEDLVYTVGGSPVSATFGAGFSYFPFKNVGFQGTVATGVCNLGFGLIFRAN